MTEPVYLDDRLSRVAEALLFETGKNLPKLARWDATQAPSRVNLAAIWGALDDTDFAELKRFIDCWGRGQRAETVISALRAVPPDHVGAAIDALDPDDRNRWLASCLLLGLVGGGNR